MLISPEEITDMFVCLASVGTTDKIVKVQPWLEVDPEWR